MTYLSDKSKKIKTADKNLSEITKLYEANIGPIYPANREWFIEISEKIEAELLNKENYEDYDEEIDEEMLKEIKELETKLGVV